MKRKVKLFILALGVILVVLGVVAWKWEVRQGKEAFPSGAPSVAVRAGGHEVIATVAGMSSVTPGSGRSDFQPDEESVVITNDKHRIVIDSDRVSIDGTEVSRLPANCKLVELWLDDEGHFSMNTDGSGVATMKKDLSQ